jgi:hypothetical protein
MLQKLCQDFLIENEPGSYQHGVLVGLRYGVQLKKGSRLKLRKLFRVSPKTQDGGPSLPSLIQALLDE